MSAEFEQARLLVIAKWLTERIVGARRGELEPGAVRALPVSSRIPVVLDGVTAGIVSRPRPTVRASITNQLKFLAWVEEHCPDQMETIRQVRPSYADTVRKSVKEHGGLVDAETGEVIPVPGVEASEGDPVIRVELTKEAEAAIAAAWRNGDIDLSAVLALPAGGDGGD
jgi:hypothetical protein